MATKNHSIGSGVYMLVPVFKNIPASWVGYGQECTTVFSNVLGGREIVWGTVRGDMSGAMSYTLFCDGGLLR